MRTRFINIALLLIALICPWSAWAAPAHVQSPSAATAFFGTTINLAYGSNVTAGNLLVCHVYANAVAIRRTGTPAMTIPIGSRSPGRAPANGSPVWGTLAPVYVWKNVDDSTGNKVDLYIGDYWATVSPAPSTHIQSNRDYYNAVSKDAQTSSSSPFDGTTGMGYGTLANRPSTCTHTTSPDGDEGGGVAYWATDQGSWNQSTSNPYGVQQNGADGVLYRCSATNTWTVHYTPYTYPHPLQGVVAGNGAGIRGSKGLGLF